MGFKKNENNVNESIEDKVVHMNPCTAATTQLNQNISAIGQLTETSADNDNTMENFRWRVDKVQ